MHHITIFVLLNFIYGIQTVPCGQSNLAISRLYVQPFVVGGSEASTGNFPWQVGVLLHTTNTTGNLVGGTYVLGRDGSIKVITVAHIMGHNPNPQNFRAVFGMLDRSSNTETRAILQPSSITVHENFSDVTLSSDISILHFNGVFSTSTVIAATSAAPACLPSRQHYNNEISVVSGWGSTYDTGSMVNRLMYASKPLFSHEECQRTEIAQYGVDATMLCAGGTGKDACQGDSGSPLVSPRELYNNGIWTKVWELVGIASWGVGCGHQNYPGIYANVFHHLSWLQMHL